MTVINGLEKLYDAIFVFNDITKRNKANKFCCVNKVYGKCNVESIEPIYSLYVGEEGSNILIVGEAPSGVEGDGPIIGGNFSDIPENNLSPIHKLRDFVKDNFGGKIPYFTDLIKCGVVKQENKEDKLPLRETRCFEYILKREIEIINPEYIFCVGERSYKILIEKANVIGFDRNKIKLLTHYCHPAAKIKIFGGVNIKKKIAYVWPYETGLISLEKALNIMKEINTSSIRIPTPNVIKMRNKSNKSEVSSDIFLTTFWENLIESAKCEINLHNNTCPSNKPNLIARVKKHFQFNYILLENDARVELYITSADKVKNKALYDSLYVSKNKIEEEYGSELKWQRLDDKYACRISKILYVGSHKDKSKWPEIHKNMIDAMVRMEKVFMPRINGIEI